MLSKKNKRTFFLYGLIFCSAILLTGLYYQKIGFKRVSKQTEQNIISNLNSRKVEVVRVVKTINQGDTLGPENCIIDKVDRDVVPENVLKSVPQNIVARIKLEPNTIVASSFTVKKEDMIVDDVRNRDFDYIKFTNGLKAGQYVDICISYQDTGLEFTVASKKKVTKVDGQIMNLNLSRKDGENINAATVDAALFKGQLYTVVYPEPENQVAAGVNYEPSFEIKEVIQQDPSIVRESVKQLKAWIRQTESGEVPQRK